MQLQDQSSYKIYSRKRLCLNFSNSPKKKKFKKKLKKVMPFLVIMVISFVTCYLIWNAVNPIFETICKDEAKSIATQITNEQSTLVVEKHNYNDFFSIIKDEKGNIQMISANVININQVTSDIAINIQKELNNSSENNLQIALGSATGMKLLSGSGPKINIKISTVGSVDTNLKSEFIEQSINHTLHRVYLEIECRVNILTPFSTIQDKIYNQVILAENVILGEIPSTYYNLEGMNSNDELLETIN